MSATKVKLLLLHAEADNLGAQAGMVSELVKHIHLTIGTDNIELRGWHGFPAGTADEEKLAFAESAAMIVPLITVDFFSDAAWIMVAAKLKDFAQTKQQKQAVVILKKCAYTSVKELAGLAALHDPAKSIEEFESKNGGILTQIAHTIAEMLGKTVLPPPAPMSKEKSFLQYSCDRTDQIDAFENGRMLRIKTPRIFFVHGPDEQSHEGFANRMKMELIRQYHDRQRVDFRCDLQKIFYPDARDLNSAQKKLLAKLHNQFGLRPDEKEHLEEERFGRLLREANGTVQYRDKDLILLQIIVNDFDFGNLHAAEVIRWANTQFFDRSQFAEDAPEVILLWCLMYSEDEKDNLAQYRKAWEQLASAHTDTVLLPEFGPVSKRDVRRWLQEYAPWLDALAQDQVIKTNFGEQTHLDMLLVEAMLSKILQENSTE